MAKQRRNNSISSAITAVTSAIRAEVDPDLSAEEKAAVVNNAMDIVDDSGVMTMAEHADDGVETAHQVDAVFEQAGIDPVEHRREGALAGAEMAVEIKQAEQIPAPAIEEEEEEETEE